MYIAISYLYRYKRANGILFNISCLLQFNIPRQASQGNEAGVNANNQGQGQPGNPSQSVPQGIQIPLGAGIAIPTLATVVIN